MEYLLMNLHQSSEVFTELVEVTARTIGLPQLYIEKDYWLTRALKYLADSDYVDKVVFKGGTSLSKVYRLINRFSEDIDLAVLLAEKSDNAGKTLIKRVERIVATHLVYLKNDQRESKGSKFRRTIYRYPRSIQGAKFTPASSELLVEINGLTNPKPYESGKLQTFIGEMLVQKNRADLINQFGLQAFSLNVLRVERTLVEKILAMVKDSYMNDPIARLSARIRHLYDICLILRKAEYKKFVQSDGFKALCNQCIKEEKPGIIKCSSYFDKPLDEAPLFTDFSNWKVSLTATYRNIFADLVYGELPDMNEISDTLEFLRTCLK
jgi:hypothetical protein